MAEELTLKDALKEVDERVAELDANIQHGKDLEELHEIPAFQRFILGGYLDKEAERLFGVLIEPNTLKRDVMENIQDKLSSIRNLKQYFATSLQNALMAPEQIEEEEAYRKEVTAHFAANNSNDTGSNSDTSGGPRLAAGSNDSSAVAGM